MSDQMLDVEVSPEPAQQTIPAETDASESDAQGDEMLHCANHPGVETLLRCNKCGKPICLKCAQLTDVGYRCKECIRGVQANYYNAVPTDNIVAFIVAFLVSAVAAPIVSIIFGIIPFRFLGWIIAFMIGGAAGGILGQIIRTAVNRRRSRAMRYFALAGIVVGVLVGSIGAAILLGIPTINLAMLIFTALAATTTYQMLR